MSRIVLTFKNNEKEKAIEEFLDSKAVPTAYIKELVWAVMQGQSVQDTKPVNIVEKSETIVSNNETVTSDKNDAKFVAFDPTKEPF